MLIPHFSPELSHDACVRENWQVRIFGRFLWQQQPANARQLLQIVTTNQTVTPEKMADADGAFIALIIDKRRGESWVFNDPLGNLRAHFYRQGHRLHVADRPAQLLPLLAEKGSLRLKRARLVEHFAASGVSSDGSFFSDIQALLPGHWLKMEGQIRDKGTPIDGLRVTCQPYYHLTATKNWPSTNHLTSHQSASQWRDHLQAATDALVEPHGIAHTAVSLSGGLDSGLIAGLLAQGNPSHKKKPTAISYAFADFPAADESPWLRQYVSLPLQQRIFEASTLLPFSPLCATNAQEVLPDAPTSTPYRAIKAVLYRQAKAQGCSLLLTGIFADHLYSGWIYHGMDSWRHKPWQALKTAARSGPGLRAKLAPFAPGKWKRPVRVHRHWLQPSAQRLLSSLTPWPENHAHHPHPQQAALVAGLYAADSFWLEDIHARQAGIQLAHPFRQRPVVEWLMQQSAWLLGNAHQPKRLARQTAAGLLPEAITERREGRTLVSFFASGVLRANIQRTRRVLSSEHSQWNEFVRPDFIQTLLEQPDTPHPEAHYVALWQCLSFELWRNRLEETYGPIRIDD